MQASSIQEIKRIHGAKTQRLATTGVHGMNFRRRPPLPVLLTPSALSYDNPGEPIHRTVRSILQRKKCPRQRRSLVFCMVKSSPASTVMGANLLTQLLAAFKNLNSSRAKLRMCWVSATHAAHRPCDGGREPQAGWAAVPPAAPAATVRGLLTGWK